MAQIAEDLRKVGSMPLAHIRPNQDMGHPPDFLWLFPTELYIESQYQRNLARKSILLINKIISEWSWTKFKSPIVVKVDGKFVVVDGQHTSIAAACHPLISQIPVMMIKADQLTERADAFIGHNRDRITVTPTQLHQAAIVAGDAQAMTIEVVCKESGVRIIPTQPTNNRFKKGDTLAIGSIRKLLKDYGRDQVVTVLSCLCESNITPITASSLKAVASVLFDKQFEHKVQADDITSVYMISGKELETQAISYSRIHKITEHKALAKLIFLRVSKDVRNQ